MKSAKVPVEFEGRQLTITIDAEARPAAVEPLAEPTQSLNLSIPRSLHKKLKMLAYDEQITMTELIARLIATLPDPA